jgi:hypothetical protein
MAGYENNTIDNIFATDAEWRTWCQAVEAALLSSGFLVAAADTGQIDLTSVARPAISSYAGYKIYKANDALAASKPMYVKIEYGCGTVTDRPLCRATVSTATNGAGTPSGVVAGAIVFVTASAIGTGFSKVLGFGGAHAAGVHISDSGSSSQGGFFMCGRFIDIANGDGVSPIIWHSGVASSTGSAMNTFSFTDGAAAWATLTNGINGITADFASTIHSGGDINTTLLYESIIYRAAKSLVLPTLLGRTSELTFTDAATSQFVLNLWGATHTFIPLPMNAGSGASNRMCVLYE